jgi:broad specificity phosphatase PhoE/predicted kinase
MRAGSRKWVIVLVGLPARGKSYTARKIARYLRWLGYPTRVFNAGELRRAKLGSGHSAEFFDPDNVEGQRILEELAHDTLDELIRWLGQDGRVGILDATNARRTRRQWIRQRCQQAGYEYFFIELVNDDPKTIEENVRANKLGSPDYEGAEPESAVRDFRRRISFYEKTYQAVEDDEGSYVKLIDRHRKTVTHRIDGWIPARVVAFLTNLQISERPVLLTRHGESEFNATGLIGGDSSLTERGRAFAGRLAHFVGARFGQRDFQVWTSTLQRTAETARIVGHEIREWRSLDEIDAGVCDGLSYAQIRERYPEEYTARARDKLRYRYPRGESYLDVIQRLDRVIIELERQQDPVLVIGHQAVLRALYAYFADIDAEKIPYVFVPLHTVIELTPRAYDCVEQRFELTPSSDPPGAASERPRRRRQRSPGR